MNTRNYNNSSSSSNMGTNSRTPENRPLNRSIGGDRSSSSSNTSRGGINTTNHHRTIDPQVFRDTQSKGLTSRIVSYHDKSRQYSKPIINRAYNRVGELPIVNFNKNNIPHRRNPLLNSTLSPSTSRIDIAAPDKTNYQSRLEILRTGVISNQPDHHRLIDLSSCDNNLVSGGGANNNQQHHNNSSNHIENESLAPLDALKEISRKRIHSNHIVSDLIKKQRAEQQQQQQQQQQNLFGIDESLINSRFGHNNCSYPIESNNSGAAAVTAGNSATSSVNISNKRNRDQSSPKTPPEQLQKKRTCNNDVLSSLSSSIFLNKPKRKLEDTSYDGNQSKIRQSELLLTTKKTTTDFNQTILNETRNLDEEKYFNKSNVETNKIVEKSVDKFVSSSSETDSLNKNENYSTNIVENKSISQQEKFTHPKLTLFNKSYNQTSSTRNQSDENNENTNENLKNDNDDEDSDDDDDDNLVFVKPKVSTTIDDNVFIKKPLGKSKLALMLSCLSGEIDNYANDTDDDVDIVDKAGKDNFIPQNINQNVNNSINVTAKSSLLSNIDTIQQKPPIVVETDKNINTVNFSKTLPTVVAVSDKEKELITNKTVETSILNNNQLSGHSQATTTLATTATITKSPSSTLPAINFSMPATLSTQIPSLTSKPILSGVSFDNATDATTTTTTQNLNETIQFGTKISSSFTSPTQKQQPVLNSTTNLSAVGIGNSVTGGGFSFNPIAKTSQPTATTPQQTNTTTSPIKFTNNQTSSSVNKSLFQNIPTQQNSPTRLDSSQTTSLQPTSLNATFNKSAFNLPTTSTTTTTIQGGFMSQQQISQPVFGAGNSVAVDSNNSLTANKSFSLLSSPTAMQNPSKQSPINSTFKFGGGAAANESNISNASFSFLPSDANDKKAAPLLNTPASLSSTFPVAKTITETTGTNTQQSVGFSFGGLSKSISTGISSTGQQQQQQQQQQQLQGSGSISFGGNTTKNNTFGFTAENTTTSPYSFGSSSLIQENKSQMPQTPQQQQPSSQLSVFGTPTTSNTEKTFQFSGAATTAVTKSLPTNSTNNAFMFGGGNANNTANVAAAAPDPNKNASNNLFSFGSSSRDMTKNADTSKPINSGGSSAFTFSASSGGGVSFGPSSSGGTSFGGGGGAASFGPSSGGGTSFGGGGGGATSFGSGGGTTFGSGAGASFGSVGGASFGGAATGGGGFGGKVSTSSSFTFNANANTVATATQSNVTTNPIFNFGGSENKPSPISTIVTTQQPAAAGVPKSMFSLPTSAIGGTSGTTETSANLFSFGGSTGPSTQQPQSQFNFSAGNPTTAEQQSQQMNLFNPGTSSMINNPKGRVIRQATRKLNK